MAFSAVGATTAAAYGSAAGAKSTATIATNAALVAGTAVSAAGAVAAAQAQSSGYEAAALGSEFESQQLEQQAGQERAVSQRRALEVRRRQRLAQSRLQASAAGSGAGATDPTITGIDLDLEEEGLYRAGLAYYEGEERAKALETGSTVRQFEANQYRRAAEERRKAGAIDAFGTLLGGFGRTALRAKYG